MGSSKTVQIIGLGYIGLPTAAVMARAGISVHGVDINPKAVEAINSGKPHIHEEGLEEVLRQAVLDGKLKASVAPVSADVHVIAVPTPINPDKSPDLSYVESASRTIAPVLKAGDLVIVESTIPPRTCVDVVAPILQQLTGLRHEQDYHLVHCPERVIPGKILHELVHNDRIIGGTRPEATEAARELYARFVQGSLLTTDATTAEMCKLMENTFRDVNIALANELAAICERLGIDIHQAIEFANHHPRVNIHQPGIGVGGHCIPVDPYFIIDAAPDLAQLLSTARQINNQKPHTVTERVLDVVRQQQQPVALLGLAYKPNVDDLRESPAVEVAAELAKKVPGLLIVEPHIEQLPAELSLEGGVELVSLADALGRARIFVELVEHSAFKNLNFGQDAIVLNNRNGFLQQAQKVLK